MTRGLKNGGMARSTKEDRLTDTHRPVWHDILGSSRDDEPTGRFVYVAEKLIAEPLRARVLMAMREISTRCIAIAEKPGYRMARREELPRDYLDRVRAHLPGLSGTISLATRRELVPRQPWMTDGHWDSAYFQYWTVAKGSHDLTIRPESNAVLFGTVPHAIAGQFELPARCVLTGHLVHKPLMGDLTEFLAIAAGAAAHGDHDVTERAVGYLLDAAKTPPLVVRQKDKTHLVLICAD